MGKGDSNRQYKDTKSTKVGKVTSKTNRHTALLVGVLNPQWRLRTEGLYLHLIIPEFLNACPVQFFTAHKHLVTSSSSSILVFPQTSHQTSAISLNRRIVLLVAAAAGVLYKKQTSTISLHFILPQSHHTTPNDPSLSRKRKKPAHLRNRPRPTRNRLPAASTTPDADAVPLDRVFAAKGAGVARVLADFHLLDLFAEGGAVSGFEEGDVSLVIGG